MFRWVEIGQTEENPRYRALHQFLQEKSHQNTFEFVTSIGDELVETIKGLQRSVNTMRIAKEFGFYSLDQEYPYPSNLLNIKAHDTIERYDSTWLPRNYVMDAVKYCMTQEEIPTDISGSVLIFGTCPVAHSCFGALNALGFSRFTFVDPNPEQNVVDTKLDLLKSQNFGAEINKASNAMVTQLPGIFSVVVNTLEMEDESSIIDEMSYFNFLASDGVILDFRMEKEIRFIKEAQKIGALTIDAYHLFSLADYRWLCHNLKDLNFSQSEIEDLYKSKIG